MKFRLTALVALAATVALVGCGGATGDKGDGGTSTDGGGGKDVTLTYAIWDDAQKSAMQEVADAFTKTHEGVKVEIQVTPWDGYWTKLQTTLTAGGGPDVFWMNGPNLGLYASNNQLAELSDLKTDDYPKGLVDLYSYEGKHFGAPKDFDSIALWYNKRLFKEAGVAEPTADWTWADMQAAAKTLTKGDVYGFASQPAGQQNLYPAVFSAGGEVIDGTKSGLTSPEAVEAVEFLEGFIKDGTSPTVAQMADTTGLDLFGSGKVAMVWTQNPNANLFKKSQEGANVQVAPLPKGKKGSISVIHGLGNVANAKSKNADLAKEFALFASGKEASDIQAAAGNALPAFNGTQDSWLKTFPEYNMQVFIDAAATAKPYPSTATGPEWHAVEEATLPKIFSGEVSVTDGLATISEALQASLDGKK